MVGAKQKEKFGDCQIFQVGVYGGLLVIVCALFDELLLKVFAALFFAQFNSINSLLVLFCCLPRMAIIVLQVAVAFPPP